jgi:hypothetical protein
MLRSLLRTGLMVVLLAGCGSSGGSQSQVTPTTVVGIWDLASADFTNGAHATATGVFSMQLRADNTASIVSCLSPGYMGTTLSCPQQRVCGTSTYTYDGTTLTITQTGQTGTKGGTVTFSPGTMTVSGPNLLGASVSAANFHPASALSTDCLPL